jgi:hypothetical protein
MCQHRLVFAAGTTVKESEEQTHTEVTVIHSPFYVTLLWRIRHFVSQSAGSKSVYNTSRRSHRFVAYGLAAVGEANFLMFRRIKSYMFL